MLTREQAYFLIDYMETMSERTNHQAVMRDMERERGTTEQELDQAARALGAIAHRTFEIL